MNDQIQETDNLLFLSDQTYDFLRAEKTLHRLMLNEE